MALTGAQRAERHKQKQRDRLLELEAEVRHLKQKGVGIQIPKASDKRRASAYKYMKSGGYGPTRLANNHEKSWDSFLAGVGAAIAMFESGKKWYLHEHSIEKAMGLLLANVNAPGEISQICGGLTMAVDVYLEELQAMGRRSNDHGLRNAQTALAEATLALAEFDQEHEMGLEIR